MPAAVGRADPRQRLAASPGRRGVALQADELDGDLAAALAHVHLLVGLEACRLARATGPRFLGWRARSLRRVARLRGCGTSSLRRRARARPHDESVLEAQHLRIAAQLFGALARGAGRDERLAAGMHNVAGLHGGRRRHAAVAHALGCAMHGARPHARHEAQRGVAERTRERVQVHACASVDTLLRRHALAHFLQGFFRAGQRRLAGSLRQDAAVAQHASGGRQDLACSRAADGRHRHGADESRILCVSAHSRAGLLRRNPWAIRSR